MDEVLVTKFFDASKWSDIRIKIHRECSLQSIFPANDRKRIPLDSHQFLSRCMHERKEDSKDSLADFIEDVIVKIRKFSDNEEGQKTKQVRSTVDFFYYTYNFLILIFLFLSDLSTGYSKTLGKIY